MFEILQKSLHQCPISTIIQIFIFGLIFVCNSVGQYRFDQWTADIGLPQNSVYSIKQTRDGYLWFTTLDGLVRFDGVRFTVFNKSNSQGISNNRFISLFEAANGDLWAVTEEQGVVRYHQNLFTSYYKAEGGTSGSFGRFISSYEDGTPLFEDSNSYFYRFANDKFLQYEPKPTSLHDISVAKPTIINCFSKSNNQQANCLINGQLVKFSLSDGLPNVNFINGIMDVDNSFWLLTSDAGLIKMNKGKVAKTYTKQDGLPEIPIALVLSEPLKLLSKDKQGALWITDLQTMRNELIARHPPTPLFEIHPGASHEDREGNLWLGTFRDGLFKVRKQVITAYSKADGLLNNNVYPIYEDRLGVIFIGTTKGVFKYQNSTFTHIKSTERLPVDALSEDDSGRLFMSASGILFVLENDTIKPIFNNHSNVIWAVHPESKNVLWLGGDNGLIRLRDDITETFTVADGLAANNTKVIIDDKNGGLWIGAYGGLTHFKDGKFEKWTESEGLPTPTIRSLYLDADNTLWIGSYDSGMARFKNGKFTHYNTKNGLYNDGAFQILEDDAQSFWISSNRGIYRVNKTELNEFAEGKRNSISSVGYGKSDGMLNVEANGGRMPGGIKSRDGRLWFPTQDGVAVINPSSIKINPKPPPVIIEDIKIDNKSIDVELLNTAISNPQSQIQIVPNQQNFEIQYTALSFINSENLRFKYKLEGLDGDWIDASNRRTAYYSHVPVGTYTFRVIAANSDGIWNEQGVSIQITILPPFYRTWQFTVLSVLAIAAFTYFLFKRRIAQIERRRLVQQNFSRQLISSQEQERKRIAAELHDSLGQRLVVIKNLAWMFLNAKDNNDKSQIEEISTEASQAIGEVKAISYNLRPYQLDRIGLTKAIMAIIRSAKTASEIDFTEEIDNLDDYFPKDAEINFYRIVQESVNNIIKHSQATKAKIEIERNEGKLRVIIADNGRGFGSESDSSNHKSDGFGLIGITERVELLGGKVEIKSVEGHGTQINILIK